MSLLTLDHKATYDEEKFSNIPWSFKIILSEIMERIVPGTVYCKWCDQNEGTERVEDWTRMFMSLSIDNGDIMETFRILLFHEIIIEISREIYDQAILGFELAGIFLLIYHQEYTKLGKKFENDYNNFKRSSISSNKQSSGGNAIQGLP